MNRVIRIREKAVFVLALLLLTSGRTAIAQDNTLPPVPQTTPIPADRPPPLLPQQEKAVQQLIDNKVDNSKAISEQIQQQVNSTFGWTVSLLNLLITVLIAIPIITGLIALALRRSVIHQLVREIKHQLEAEREQLKKEREQLKIQATAELEKQLKAFDQELGNIKAACIEELQNLSLAAQQEKEKVFQELTKITPSIIQQEFVAPEIQDRIKALTERIESLQSTHSPIFLTAEDYLKQGNALYFERRYEDALRAYDKAIDVAPDMADAWLAKSKPLRRLKRYEEAIAANDQGIRLRPDNPWGWFGKGFALTDMQKYEESISAYDKAIAIKPYEKVFWRNKGYVLTKLGQYEEALSCLEKALELDPDSSSTYYWKAYYHLAQNQIELAIDYLEKTIALKSNYRELVKTDPDFDSIRENERFKQLVNG